jgi:hypothetical protein
MFRSRALLSLPAACLFATLALAQAPTLPLSAPSLGAARPPATTEKSTVQLSAVFTGEARPVRSGLVWRIYEERSDTAPPALVERSNAPTPSFSLNPGNYVVHAAYGFAGSSRRITVQTPSVV